MHIGDLEAQGRGETNSSPGCCPTDFYGVHRCWYSEWGQDSDYQTPHFQAISGLVPMAFNIARKAFILDLL